MMSQERFRYAIVHQTGKSNDGIKPLVQLYMYKISSMKKCPWKFPLKNRIATFIEINFLLHYQIEVANASTRIME